MQRRQVRQAKQRKAELDSQLLEFARRPAPPTPAPVYTAPQPVDSTPSAVTVNGNSNRPGVGDLLSVRFSSEQVDDYFGTVLDTRQYHLAGANKGYCVAPADVGSDGEGEEEEELIRVINGTTSKPDSSTKLTCTEFLVHFPEDREIWRLCAQKHKRMYTIEEVYHIGLPYWTKRMYTIEERASQQQQRARPSQDEEDEERQGMALDDQRKEKASKQASPDVGAAAAAADTAP